MDIKRKGLARNKLIRRAAWLLITEIGCEAKFYRLLPKGRKHLKNETENGAGGTFTGSGGDAE